VDKTIVYYTSNGDYPTLESAVRTVIREHSQGLPIVSVSQQPLDFGTNICVGDIGRSRHNIYRQLRIGAEHAQTRFLVVCEADFLYPPQWFQFTPPREDTYYYPKECYILWKKKPAFFRKMMQQLTGVVAREHLLRLLDKLQAYDQEGEQAIDPFMRGRIYNFTATAEFDAGPVVTLKTDRQMHIKSPHSNENRAEVLPIWGTPADLWKRMGL
jgi:hypothetical protein